MKVCLFILLFVAQLSVLAQSLEKRDSTSPYLFPEFVSGKVKLKNGTEANSSLNYYTVTQEIIFEQQGNRLALSELNTIDTVFIAGRKFIPIDKSFYEVLTDTQVPLLVKYTASLINAGVPTAYGGNSSFATSLSEISATGRMYGLKLPENYTTIIHHDYLLKKKYNYYEANNLKQFLRVFPGKDAEIKNYIKENNIDFKKQQDIIKLVLYSCQ